MATYLSVCQDVMELIGAQSSLDTVDGATGIKKKVVNTVKRAWNEIQGRRKDWYFLRRDTTFNTVAGTTEYSLSDVFGSSISDVGSYRYLKYNDKVIDYIDYDLYYLREIDDQDQSTPSVISIDPYTQYIYINPPADAYTIGVYYFKKPQVLSDDTDVLILPSEFTDVVTYKAAGMLIAKYGDTNSASIYLGEHQRLLGSMMRSQIPGRRVRHIGIV